VYVVKGYFEKFLHAIFIMDLRERIRTIRKKLGLTQMEFAEKLGKSWRTIQDWEAGKRNIPEPELRLISQTFGISYEWLKTGQGEIFEKKPSIEEIILAEQRRIKENSILVPLVGKAGAGFPQMKGDIEIIGYIETKKIPRVNPYDLIAVEVHGDSMEPTLQEGDKVIAKIYIGDGFDIPNRKIVIVANQDGELLVKRLMKKDGLILLTSDNPNYPPIVPQEARIIGVALKLLREISL
jgi:phage repressor protein C with HTH and peptisase S24 domain